MNDLKDTPEITPKRCAIYTRKSTEEGLEKEYNTLEAQFDACAAYIQSQVGKGWYLADKRYDDGGFTGGNMNRPALQQLLKDVADGHVDVVVVYKIDRISRSLADFNELTRLFERYNVSLVAVTQQIDTSTSMGRMIINLLISFAQFERECCSDRVRDKMCASRKRGRWTGGVTPYGYQAVDHKLVINPEQAEKVRYAFERYAELPNYLQITRELNEKFGGWKGDKQWNIEHVRHLLTQPIHAGKIKDPHTGELFEGIHEAIVPMELWLKVQNIIDGRKTGKRESRCTRIAPLKGVIKCGYCGCAMVPTFCSKNGERTFHYYRCDRTHKHLSETCELKNISASAIETVVFEQIGNILTNEYYLQLAAGEDAMTLAQMRQFGLDKQKQIAAMTTLERQRLIELFIKRIDVKRDGVDIIVRHDGLIRLMNGAEKAKSPFEK